MKSTYYVTYDNLAFRQELCPANIGKTVCDKVAMWAFWAVPGKNGFLWRVLNKSQIQSSNAYRWSPGYPILRWWAQANSIYDPKNMCQLFQDIFFIWALSMRYNHHQGSWFMKKAHKFSTPPSFDGLLTHLEIRVPSFCFLVFSNNKKNAQSHFHILHIHCFFVAPEQNRFYKTRRHKRRLSDFQITFCEAGGWKQQQPIFIFWSRAIKVRFN